MQKLSCPRGGVSYVTFSPDGDILAGFAQNSNALYCWFRSRSWEKTGLEHSGPITGVAFHPTGRTLAYAGIARGGFFQPRPAIVSSGAPASAAADAPAPSVWRRRFAHEAHRPFTGVLFYPLAEADEFVPNRVSVPQTEGAILQPHTWARGLAFTPDGRVLLAGQVELHGLLRARANLYHWHFTETGGIWRAADPVGGCGATEHGGALVGGYLGLTGAWGVAACPVEPATGLYVPDVRAANAVAVAPARELIATCAQGPVSVWHLRAGPPVATITTNSGWTNALAFAPDGGTLAVGHGGTAGGSVSFWEPLTGTAGPERDFGVGPVTALAYAPDGLTLAVAGRGGLVVVDTD